MRAATIPPPAIPSADNDDSERSESRPETTNRPNRVDAGKIPGEFLLFEKRHPFILAGYRVSPHRHNWQGASTQCPFSRRFVVGSSHTQQLPFAVSSHTQPFA